MKAMTVPTPLEELRRRYKPDEMRVLFVGESPPASGKFFYKGDSNLARYTQEAFSRVYNTRFERSEDFLQTFRTLACYLDDLCLAPINRLPKAERRRQRAKSIDSLAARTRAASPQAIVVVMLGIRRHVEQAVEQADLHGVMMCSLPFPAQGNQRRYVAQLADALRTLQEAGILPRVLSHE
jgi:hypothetical protein